MSNEAAHEATARGTTTAGMRAPEITAPEITAPEITAPDMTAPEVTEQTRVSRLNSRWLALVGLGALGVAELGRRSPWLAFQEIDSRVADPWSGAALPETSSLVWLLFAAVAGVAIWALGHFTTTRRVTFTGACVVAASGLGLSVAGLRALRSLPSGSPISADLPLGPPVLIGAALTVGMIGVLLLLQTGDLNPSPPRRPLLGAVALLALATGIGAPTPGPGEATDDDNFSYYDGTAYRIRSGRALVEARAPGPELIINDGRVFVFGSDSLWELRDHRMFRVLGRTPIDEGYNFVADTAQSGDSLYVLLLVDDGVQYLEHYDLVSRSLVGRYEANNVGSIDADPTGQLIYSTYTNDEMPGIFVVDTPADIAETRGTQLFDEARHLNGVAIVDGEAWILVGSNPYELWTPTGPRVLLETRSACDDRRSWGLIAATADIDDQGRVLITAGEWSGEPDEIELFLIERDGTTRSRTLPSGDTQAVRFVDGGAVVIGDSLIEIDDLDAFFADAPLLERESGCSLN